MFDEYEKKKRKDVSRMRSIMDYGMGILIILMGLFFLLHNTLHIQLSFFSSNNSVIDYFFGAICLIYGSWRIYRGYKKEYFK